MTHSNIKQIKLALETVAGTVGTSKGKIVARRGFYYRMGKTSATFAASVNDALEDAGLSQRVLEHGEKWAEFRGGQTVAQGSHFWAVIG